MQKMWRLYSIFFTAIVLGCFMIESYAGSKDDRESYREKDKIQRENLKIQNRIDNKAKEIELLLLKNFRESKMWLPYNVNVDADGNNRPLSFYLPMKKLTKGFKLNSKNKKEKDESRELQLEKKIFLVALIKGIENFNINQNDFKIKLIEEVGHDGVQVILVSSEEAGDWDLLMMEETSLAKSKSEESEKRVRKQKDRKEKVKRVFCKLVDGIDNCLQGIGNISSKALEKGGRGLGQLSEIFNDLLDNTNEIIEDYSIGDKVKRYSARVVLISAATVSGACLWDVFIYTSFEAVSIFDAKTFLGGVEEGLKFANSATFLGLILRVTKSKN